MDIFEFLSKSGPSVSALAILAFAFVVIWKIYLQYKSRVGSAQTDAEARRSRLTPESLDNLAQLLVDNFSTLNSFYSENLSQYRTSSIASIAVAVLGFIVIISGVLLALIGAQVSIGIVSSAAGIVGEAAAMLFFKQTRTFQEQMESSLKKLVSSQYLMTSIALARELDGEAKEREIVEINSHLRDLMNVLHETHLAGIA
ncbi:hypothetical protein MYX76_17285 [Desulfobacterota bacterium AH_259_B03_O07]|nr:hypothetical protein [Desulfobacterota bacterium AH_259_B03_O07]